MTAPPAFVLFARRRYLESLAHLAKFTHKRGRPRNGLCDWIGLARHSAHWQSQRNSARKLVALRKGELERAIVEAERIARWREQEIANGFDAEQDRRDEVVECWGRV